MALRCSASLKMRSRPSMRPLRQVASSRRASNCDVCFRGSRIFRRPGDAHASSWVGLGQRPQSREGAEPIAVFQSGGLGHARRVVEAEPGRVALLECFLQHAPATRPYSGSRLRPKDDGSSSTIPALTPRVSVPKIGSFARLPKSIELRRDASLRPIWRVLARTYGNGCLALPRGPEAERSLTSIALGNQNAEAYLR